MASAFGSVFGIAIAFSSNPDAGDLDFGVEVLAAHDGGESEGGTSEEGRFFQEVTSGIDAHTKRTKRKSGWGAFISPKGMFLTLRNGP